MRRKKNNQTLNINPTLNEKQKEALRILLSKNGVTEILFGGGAGSGKSFLGCLFLIVCSLKYPGTRWLLGRARLVTLKATTLKTFFEVCKSLKLQEYNHFKYNQQRNEIRFYNGSEIILKDLFSYPSDPSMDSLGSLEISGGFLDECNQISEFAKNIVSTRIRYKLDEYDLEPKLLLTCNPSKNWTFNEFYKKTIDGKIEPHKRFLQALHTDNKFISKHYINNLEKQDEITKRRLLHGIWEYSDELSLFNYEKILEIFEIDEIKKEDYKNVDCISIDVARLGKDKTCITVWSGFYVLEIIELSKNRLTEQQEKIKTIMEKYGVTSNSKLIIDSDGVGGGLADNFPGCVEIMNNSKAKNNENYQNLKTQLYFKLADKVNLGEVKVFTKNNDIKTRITQELQVVKRENIDKDGKIQINNKANVKQQLSRSPDISDSLAYRMYFEVDNFIMPSFF